jgi:Outer membrane protein
MKKILITVFAVIVSFSTLSAQKLGYINTETILSQIPAYAAAQQQISELSAKYKATVETDLKEIEKLYQSYQKVKNTLSASERAAKEDEIISREKLLKEKEKIYFGEEGILAKASEQLLNPIQTMVNEAIVKYAETGGFAMIIDLAATPGVVYRNDAFDLSQQIINIINQ